ncbi:MAG: hypothetical protein UHD09_04580 [Bifidobacterium sp.]|nr:hypothetical protein [Bifidobacterium sp.]
MTDHTGDERKTTDETDGTNTNGTNDTDIKDTAHTGDADSAAGTGAQAPSEPPATTTVMDETPAQESGAGNATDAGKATKDAKSAAKGTAKKDKRRHHWRWQSIAVVVVALCAIVAALFANGNIPGTPRAQLMSQCRDAETKAGDALNMAQMAVKDAKAYRDDASHDMDAADLRQMAVLMDDMGKEPEIPACSIFMTDARLSEHATASTKLKDAYLEISRELLLLTTGTDSSSSAGAASGGSGSEEDTTGNSGSSAGTGTDSGAATTGSGTDSGTDSRTSEQSTPSPSASASASVSPSASASASPKATSSPSASASSSAKSSASTSGKSGGSSASGTTDSGLSAGSSGSRSSE